MAQTIDISQIWAQQLPGIAQGSSWKQPSWQRDCWSARGGSGHASDISTGASETSSSKDGDSDSERDSSTGGLSPASSGGLSPELRRRLPAFFRPPPGLEAPNGAPAWGAPSALGGTAAAATPAPTGAAPATAPARTALRSTARPFLSQESPAGAPRAAPAAKPAAESHAAGPAETPCSGESMRTHLQGLRGEGHRRTLVVRRIHRLGLDSPEKLKAHFEQYGAVEAVLVTHSHVRSERRARQAVTTRIRPAHLGFVVMGGSEGADAAVGDGETHLVLGSPIEVQRFVPHHREHAGGQQDSEATDASEALADDEQDSATEPASPPPRHVAAP